MKPSVKAALQVNCLGKREMLEGAINSNIFSVQTASELADKFMCQLLHEECKVLGVKV